jgi:DNA-binding transcriptional MerR regulator
LPSETGRSRTKRSRGRRRELLTIGALAAAADVNVETVRYYERRGLLLPPRRTGSGYRQYGRDDVWRLTFIRRAKGLGFTLSEIGELLGNGSVLDVLTAAQAKLAAIEEDMAALVQQRGRLQRLVQTCATGDAADCLDLTV